MVRPSDIVQRGYIVNPGAPTNLAQLADVVRQDDPKKRCLIRLLDYMHSQDSASLADLHKHVHGGYLASEATVKRKQPARPGAGRPRPASPLVAPNLSCAVRPGDRRRVALPVARTRRRRQHRVHVLGSDRSHHQRRGVRARIVRMLFAPSRTASVKPRQRATRFKSSPVVSYPRLRVWADAIYSHRPVGTIARNNATHP
jgi:hypothetical protein